MDLIVEDFDKPWPAGDELRFTADKVVWPEGWEHWPFVEDGPGGHDANYLSALGIDSAVARVDVQRRIREMWG